MRCCALEQLSASDPPSSEPLHRLQPSCLPSLSHKLGVTERPHGHLLYALSAIWQRRALVAYELQSMYFRGPHAYL